MVFFKYAVTRVFGGYGIGLDKALWKKDIGCKMRFPGILAHGETKGGGHGESPPGRGCFAGRGGPGGGSGRPAGDEIPWGHSEKRMFSLKRLSGYGQ